MHTSGKKLLLINPWIFDFAAFDLWSQPLGLLYIASFLRYQGFDVSYIDCLRSDILSTEIKQKKYGIGKYQREIVKTPSILNDIPRKFARYGIPETEFVDKLRKFPNPDAILITSVMTYWYPGLSKIVEMLRQIYPEIPIILGGIYASLMPEHAMEAVKPDYIIEGPGEWQVLRLLEKILDFKVDTNLEFKNLDDYPYPAFDLVPNLRYICIMTSRGCPFNCSFCAQKHIAAKFSQRKPERVVEEIVYHSEKYKLADFAFYDDALFINKEEHIKIILHKLIETRLSIRLHTPNGLFARDIDEELAQLMFHSNFKTIRLSFETSNEDRRKDMNNKISNEGMQMAVTNLVKAGYSVSNIEAYVIMGLPDQNLDEILESIIFVNNLGVQVRLASFSPIPKTRDFERAVRSGLIPENIDPLLTNKTIFPLKSPDLDYDTFRKVRNFSHILNDAAKKDIAPFAKNKMGNSLSKDIEGIYLTNKVYPVKKRETLELKIEKLAFGGKGISYLDNYVIFVPKTLPGDVVKAEIIKRKTNYAETRLLEILKNSPLRQKAPCPYFGWCGGCTWQNLAYSEQLKIKKSLVRESIEHIAGIQNISIFDTLPSKQVWAYRNKMEFSFSDRCWLLPEELENEAIKKDFALGLHVPGSFDKILNIDSCMLQSDAANKVLNIVRKYSKENHLEPYGIRSQEGYLRFLVIRQSLYSNEIMVNIVTHKKEPTLLYPLAELINSEVPEVSSIVNNINSRKAQVAFGEEEIILSGQKNISDKIGNYSFEISANSFFQTNTSQAEVLYKIVIDYAKLTGNEIVWDLYAGTGTISMFLAKRAGFVYAFELIESAVNDAIKNAEKYGIKNLKFISGDLLHNLSTVDQEGQVIVVDPPRSGMHPKVCKFLSESNANRIIYVSCNPTTMARDLEILSLNFRVLKIQPVDMFPHTYHIESVALLERKS